MEQTGDASPRKRGAVARLLDFSDAYPQWFIGSNADLPIVGAPFWATTTSKVVATASR